MGESVQALCYDRYGTPDVVSVRDIEAPVPGDGQVLIEVKAAGVNPYDWHYLTGTPFVVRTQSGLRRPKLPVLGLDVAGRVLSAGPGVTRFQPGDDVFGLRTGSFAEQVCVRAEGALARLPGTLNYEQAAAVPLAGLTALQGLRDKGQLRSGQRVLVNGASGGIGTFAVQLAKGWGAHVTGVCRTANVDLVRGLGADHVVDYTAEDFTRGPERYDILLDTVGKRPLRELKRALAPGGVVVAVAGSVPTMLRLFASSRFGRPSAVALLTRPSGDDLETLRDLIEAGSVTPTIDRTYPLREGAAALAYVGAGHSRGKVVITM